MRIVFVSFEKVSNMCDRFRFSAELCLHKMVIESVRSVYAQPVHHNKRDAIGEGVIFVLILLEVAPPFMKKVFIDMHYVYGWAAEKSITNLNGFGMMSTAIEKSNDLIEHIGRYDQLRKCFYGLLPMLKCSVVMLVISEFEREQITGIDEYRRHCEVR